MRHYFISLLIFLCLLAGISGGILYEHLPFLKRQRSVCVIDLKYLMDREKRLLLKEAGKPDGEVKKEIDRFAKCLEEAISSRKDIILVKAAVVSGAKDITKEVERLCLTEKQLH